MGRHAERRRNRGYHRRPFRRQVVGTAERPRLSVFRSAVHIYAQVINDETATTLAEASTRTAELRKTLKKTSDIAAAQKVGQLLADRAKTAGVTKVVFDRGSHAFHGRVKALAEGARKGGLSF